MATETGRRAFVLGVCSLLAGCGLTQTIKDGAIHMTTAVFYKKIKILRLDLSPRAASNADEAQTPLSTMVRVYQLKERHTVEAADYQTLLTNADSALKGDVLAVREVLVMPQGSVALTMPMEDEAHYVAVIGLFNHPDTLNNTWRLVLARDDLDADKPRLIELGDGWLALAQE